MSVSRITESDLSRYLELPRPDKYWTRFTDAAYRIISSVGSMISSLNAPSKPGMHQKQWINSEILKEMTASLQEVGAALHYEDSHLLSISPITGWTSIGSDNSLELSSELYSSYQGKGPFTKEEVLGVMAHEVSHRILKHGEKRIQLENDLEKHHQLYGTKTSFTADIETDNRYQEERRAIKRQLNNYSYQTEKEADLYPFQHSAFYSIALIHALIRMDQIEPSNGGGDHPSSKDRVRYTIEEFRRIYPNKSILRICKKS